MSYFQMEISHFFSHQKKYKTQREQAKIFIVSTPKNHWTGLEVGTFATKNHKEAHG